MLFFYDGNMTSYKVICLHNGYITSITAYNFIGRHIIII